MLNKRHFEVTTDVMAVDKPPIYLGAVKQLDGTMITVYPLNAEVPMNLEGCTARLYVKKPNDVYVYQEESVEMNTEDSAIVIQCKNSAFSQVGKVLLEVEIFDDDLYVTTTPNFEIDVVEKLSIEAGEGIEEAPEFDMLTRIKAYVDSTKEYIDKFKELLAELGEEDNTMLENLLVVRGMMESIDDEVERLEREIEKAKQVELQLNNNEEERERAEAQRKREFQGFNATIQDAVSKVNAAKDKVDKIKIISTEEIDRILESVFPKKEE